MPPNAEPDLLVDTSAAVALVLGDHHHHDVIRSALDGYQLGLAGHAAFETYSVLTRLPPPARRPPVTVAHLLQVNFPRTRHLSDRSAAALLSQVGKGRISGGAVYDALVGAAAAEHSMTLATLDQRAVGTYRILGIDVMMVAP